MLFLMASDDQGAVARGCFNTAFFRQSRSHSAFQNIFQLSKIEKYISEDFPASRCVQPAQNFYQPCEDKFPIQNRFFWGTKSRCVQQRTTYVKRVSRSFRTYSIVKADRSTLTASSIHAGIVDAIWTSWSRLRLLMVISYLSCGSHPELFCHSLPKFVTHATISSFVIFVFHQDP